ADLDGSPCRPLVTAGARSGAHAGLKRNPSVARDHPARELSMTIFVPFGNQASRKRTVLVAGATGVVGTALPPQLRRHRLIAPAHRRTPPGYGIAVHGDDPRPGLGPLVDRYPAPFRQVDLVAPAAGGRRRHHGDSPRRARRWR